MARFIRRGVSKFYFVPTVASPTTAITRPELTAGTNLSPSIADVAGWMLENQPVSTPDMGSDFDSQIPGIDQAGDSSFTFYEDKLTAVIETLLPKGASGYVAILRKGDIPTSPSLDLFAVTVASRSAEYSAGNDAARFMVKFSITAKPALDLVVPAA